MRKIVISLFVVFANVLSSQTLTWDKILNLDYVWDLKVTSNGYLFACRQGLRGILRSTDNGFTWSTISLTQQIQKIISDDKDHIYVGAGGSYPGILKSSDYGNTWVVSNPNMVHARSMHTSPEGFIYVGERNGNFLRSTDHGDTWDTTSVTSTEITSITTSPNGQIYVCALYGKIFTSTDTGTTWTQINYSILISPSTILCDTNNVLFIGGDEYVARSTDNGINWTLCGTFPYATTSSLLGLDSSNAVYYAYGKVYKTSNQGINWDNLGGPIWVTNLVTYSGKIYLSSYSGVYRSGPPFQPYAGNNYFPLKVGNSWQYLDYVWAMGAENYALGEIHIIDSMIINEKTYFRFTDDNVVGKSPIRGRWIRYSFSDKILFYLYNDTDRVYMDFNKVAGQSFTQYCYPFYFSETRTVSVEEGDYTGFGKTFHWKGYRYSIDDIDQFSDSLGPSNNSIIQAILYSSNDTTIYDHGNYPKFRNFTPKDTVQSQIYSLDLNVTHALNRFPSMMGEPVNYIRNVKMTGYYLKDSIIAIDTVSLLGSNYNDRWTRNFNLNLSLLMNGYSFYYKFIAMDKGIIPHYSFSPDTGFYKLIYLDTLTSITYDERNFYTFSLSQNYPNPFNPSTRIHYQVSSNSYVLLKVYDVLGNEVATLIDEYKPAGTYEVEFSAKGGQAVGSHQLASGVYYYQLKTGEFIQTKKMMLLR